MNRKTIIITIAVILLSAFIISCNSSSSTSVADDTSSETSDTDNSDASGGSGDSDDSDTSPINPDDGIMKADTHEEAGDYTWDNAEVVDIVFIGDAIEVNGSGATASGSTLTISSGGTYRMTGTLSNGQIIVDSSDEKMVQMILSGIDVTSQSNAPVIVKNAEKAVIILTENTRNTISDTNAYDSDDSEDDAPTAALFSKENLSISGTGTLIVNASYKDGITSKDGLIIHSGTIFVTADDDGIRGKDYLVVTSGLVDVTAGGDGLKSDNDDEDTGVINIESGDMNISAGSDGIQAASVVSVSGGDINITTAGGSSGTFDGASSAKGIKAGDGIFLTGGIITIDSTDDAIHSSGKVVIDDGSFELSSGDDGIHADTQIMINDGNINISKSYEGVESSGITINGGELHIIASDDGINIAGGTDSSSLNRPGQGDFTASENDGLIINSGYIAVEADGDGIDVNGSIEMAGGVVIVHGPTENNNGALDYDISFNMTGGFLVAAGSSGMAKGPDDTSSQKSAVLTFSTRPAGTLVHIQDSAGTGMLTFAPFKAYQSIVFSSPELVSGTACDVYFGGSATGTETDGLYEGGTYSPGVMGGSFTISG